MDAMSSKPLKKRLVAISVGTSLTVVTGLLLAVGFFAVRWLAGDAGTPQLTIAPQGSIGNASSTTEASRQEVQVNEASPLVLLPQSGSSVVDHDPTPLESPLTVPDWDYPAPAEPRNARSDLGPRYR